MNTAKTTTVIFGALLVATIFLTKLPCPAAQSPAAAPAPSLDCMPYFYNMTDCLTYVQAKSNLTKPEKACCPEFAGLVESQPICLCQLLGNAASLGLELNLSKALKLPSVCGVTTPSVSLCSDFGVPVAAPTPEVSAVPVAAPAPSLDCTSYLSNTTDCLTYVRAGSNLSKPDKGCCPEFAGLVESQPICLCQLLGNPGNLGIQLNLSKALKLPSVCGVSTPPVSLCSDYGVPVAVPTSGEAPGPGVASPTVAASPSAGNNGNGASSIGIPALSFLVGLAIA